MRIVMGVDGSDAALTALDLVTTTNWPADTKVRLVGAFDLLTDWKGHRPANGWQWRWRPAAIAIR